ncbi:DedA family protein [Legionella busanensis]|uniref:DedA family protein n=1 Tax=Legionella busanensis TaxID=190655 RepID=A0A378JR46_9GAMM|nr:DedA family protein [Legionella busanensis]STX50592.1 DedA family protein [Legionella busanensis]
MLMDFIYFLLHIDTYLVNFASTYGIWTYLVLFAVIFCETGLIITPFLPGDSLLFVVGSFAAYPSSPLNIIILFLLLSGASILGNQVNYLIGRKIGPRVFTAKDSRFFNRKHLERAHQFYEKNGGKTIFLARFLPIIRTFVPFVAGVSYMRPVQFSYYNILSAVVWVGSLLFFGYFFGSIPIIKENFSIVIYSIIILSCLPPIITFIMAQNKR